LTVTPPPLPTLLNKTKKLILFLTFFFSVINLSASDDENISFLTKASGLFFNHIFNPTLTISYEYQYWEPELIKNTEYDTTTLSLFKIDLSLNRYLEFKYRKTFGGSKVERQNDLVQKRENLDETFLETIIGDINIPFKEEKDFSINIFTSFKQELFTANLKALEDKKYIDGIESSIFLKGDILETSTIFKEYQFGIKKLILDRRNSYGKGGIFHLVYKKPYAVTVREEGLIDTEVSQDSKNIYNAEFKTTGLFLEGRKGADKNKFSFGGIRSLYIGLSDIELQNNKNIEYKGKKLSDYEVGFTGAKSGLLFGYSDKNFDLDASLVIDYRKYYEINFFLEAVTFGFYKDIYFNEDLIVSFDLSLRF
jgi:hypothetical protein